MKKEIKRNKINSYVLKALIHFSHFGINHIEYFLENVVTPQTSILYNFFRVILLLHKDLLLQHKNNTCVEKTFLLIQRKMQETFNTNFNFHRTTFFWIYIS